MATNLILIPSKLVNIPKNADLWWSPVNLLRFCRTPFLSNIYGGLLLDIYTKTRNKEKNVISTAAFVLLPTRFAYFSVRIIKPFYYL